MEHSSTSIASTVLYEIFRENRSRDFVFVEPGGNAGDSLIYRGAEKLARTAGISFHTVQHESFMLEAYPDDAVIYIHGGGGYVPWWSGKPMDALGKAISTHKGLVVQGPQTVFPEPAFLKERVVNALSRRTAKHFVLFTRERPSYEALRQVLPGWVDLRIDHDTALNLEAGDVDVQAKGRGYTFYAIRQDKEQAGIPFRDYLAAWGDPVKLRPRFEDWLKLHAEAGAIVTNRLHSSIAGWILGKSTTLLPNSYHKNRAVWEYSLEPRGVKWATEVPVGQLARWMNQSERMKAIFGSTGVQKIVHTYHGLSAF